jgi:alpha-amylase
VTAARLRLCFGVHNHQPAGNFDDVLAQASARSYGPFLDRLAAHPAVALTAHFSGTLLEWLRERAPAVFDRLGEVVARGQVELLTGGFFEPILAVLPDHDKIAQVEQLTEFIKTQFGVRPRGMWLAERVWEPHLPRVLREAGVEYVLVDDRHFSLAGLDAEALGGYYLTEEQGAVLAVFPISQRLRYLIPFAEVEQTLAYLESRRDAGTLTVVDDGEKFGVWPGTYPHVYERGWLDRFFDGLLASPWLELSTFADVVDRCPPSGRVYLPAASYREMGEWALPAAAGRELAAVRHRLVQLTGDERAGDVLRGGFWRGFLVKYPEVADLYWKMLRLSTSVHREAQRRPREARLAAARRAVWRGQANDAYWHGVFGGCYLPHLRRAVRQSLLTAERLLDEVGATAVPSWTRQDVNGDGRVEVLVRTADLAVTINPAAGGCVTELAYLPAPLDLADVLARRPESYHDEIRERTGQAADDARDGAHTIHAAAAPKEAGLERLLEYDEFRRACLLEGLFGPGEPLDPLAPWSQARVALGRRPMVATVETRGERVDVTLRHADEATAVDVRKRLVVGPASLRAEYGLDARPPGALAGGRWAVQWNLALTAPGDGRYLTLPGHPALGSRGRRAGLRSVGLVDEWLGLEVEITWEPEAELAWAPVETVSLSETGFERIYQGTAFLLIWSLAERPEARTLATELKVRSR